MTTSRTTFLGTLCTLALSAVVVAGCGAETEARAARHVSPDRTAAKLERIVRERVDGGRATGIVAGMVFPGGRTRVVAYGKAGGGKRLDARSVFEIGSITKVFTGSLLSEMARRGEVQLTDPVATLLPGVSVPSRGGRQITLEDLATQTSGLPRLPTNIHPKDPTNPYADYTVDALYEFLRGYTLPRDPGAQYEYSNVGVGLLGHALARRRGKSYEDLVRERILQPLRMRSTGIALRPALRRRFVSGHDERGRVVPHWDLPTLAGAGALRSSMGDMLTFARANLERDGGRLGQAMAAAHAPRATIDAQMNIGLNWHSLRAGDRDIVWHNGGTGGFSSFIGLDKTRGTAIVVLSNSSPSAVDDIGLHLLDKRLPLVPPQR